MINTFISTIPFCAHDSRPMKILQDVNCDVLVNPTGKKLTTETLGNFIEECEILIAGTENITATVMDKAPKLRMISRVGIGLDSVDIEAAKNRNIIVTNTPDAPSPAVGELTIGLMLDLARGVTMSSALIKNNKWQRHFGVRLAKSRIGIIGFGRIGTIVAKSLQAIGVNEILINDTDPSRQLAAQEIGLRCADKNEIYEQCDFISLHLPMTPDTDNMITKKEIDVMMPGSALINTARGGIINEGDLRDALLDGHLSGAAIDVFVDEPYQGPLCDCPTAVLTAHMGSMTKDCRTLMEIEACEEAHRFLQGETLLNPAWI